MLSHKSIAKKSQNCQEKFVVDFFQKISYYTICKSAVAKTTDFLRNWANVHLFCPARSFSLKGSSLKTRRKLLLKPMLREGTPPPKAHISKGKGDGFGRRRNAFDSYTTTAFCSSFFTFLMRRNPNA